MRLLCEFESLSDDSDILSNVLYDDGRRDGHVNAHVSVIHDIYILVLGAIRDSDSGHNLIEAVLKAEDRVCVYGDCHHIEGLIGFVSKNIT